MEKKNNAQTLAALDQLAELLGEFGPSLPLDVIQLAEGLKMGITGPVKETGYTLWKLKEALEALEKASLAEAQKVFWSKEDEIQRKYDEIPRDIIGELENDIPDPVHDFLPRSEVIESIVNAYERMQKNNPPNGLWKE